MALAVAQGLWGEGYLGPGTAEYSASLVKDLALTSEHNLAILGIGLAGPARDIVRETDVWVSGYESREKAIDEANRQCAASGLAEKIQIAPYNPEAAQFAQDKYNAAFSLEEFCFVENKEQLLKQIAGALKPNGSLLFIDYVLPATDADLEILASSFDGVWGQARLWTVDQYKQAIADAGFTLTADRDLNGDYLPMIERGWTRWRKVLASLQEGRAGSEHRSRVMRLIGDEAAKWADRLDALNSGKLIVHLFQAQKPGEPS